MTQESDDDVSEDPRLLELARQYLHDVEAGECPDRAAYLARYPELATELAEFLDGIDLAQSLAPVPISGRPLGDFQIVRELGHGGMGTVYEATQLSLGRRVALKVLPFAAALDNRQLQRFRTEAYAAAQLHHNNIVPVYAVGCERGVHFYAMQLIDGRSLARVLEEFREDMTAAGPESTLQNRAATTAPSARGTRRETRFAWAARIAATVAEALDFAHEAGVIHRDVKPANLLLDSQGKIWVTDFGLAQVAGTNVTQTGDLVGTLRYMSPEQAAGRREPVDHRADVYSLGATLYELLGLVPIFPSEDRSALLYQILNEDPRPLRQVNPQIPIELETIVLKATAKSPVDRYATAADLADDLQRFLDQRPIQARRPTWLDRGRKWLRRHPAHAGAALILLACGIVGLSITTAVVAQEQARTQQAYLLESRRALEAEARFELARRAADEMIRLAEDELTDNPFQEGLRKHLLEAALKYYQEFIALRAGQPEAQQELGRTEDRVKRILEDLAVLKADRHFFLLRETAVLDDLELTADQRQRVADAIEAQELQRRDRFRFPWEPPPPGDHSRTLAMARDHEAALAAILTPAQLQRIPQIALQCQGPRALLDSDVVSTLKLTPEQRSRLRGIDLELHSGRRGPTQEGHEDRARATLQKMLTVLSDDQQAQWRTLTGKRYDGPLVPRRSGGPPRGEPGRPDPGGPGGPFRPDGRPGRPQRMDL